jgi:hypothetical protein
MSAHDDLSGPYESWSTAPEPKMKHARRTWRRVLVGGALLLGALTAWVLVLNLLAPIWRRPPGVVFLLPVASALVGAALIQLGLRRRWRPRPGLVKVGLCFMLPVGVVPLLPLVLYVNQALDPHTPTCAVYTIVEKARVRTARSGVAHQVVLSRAGKVVTTIRLPQEQYMRLAEGQSLWIEVADGLLGIRYVHRVSEQSIMCGDAQRPR